MRHKCDMWDKGIGSPSIMLIHASTRAHGDDKVRALWDALDSAYRAIRAVDCSGDVMRRFAVAILNERLEDTGQLFRIEPDGTIDESRVVQAEFRELIAGLLDV